MKATLLFTSLLLLAGCAGQQPEGLRQLFGNTSCAKPDAEDRKSVV